MSGDNSPIFTGIRRSIAQQDSEQRGKNVWVSRPAPHRSVNNLGYISYDGSIVTFSECGTKYITLCFLGWDNSHCRLLASNQLPVMICEACSVRRQRKNLNIQTRFHILNSDTRIYSIEYMTLDQPASALPFIIWVTTEPISIVPSHRFSGQARFWSSHWYPKEAPFRLTPMKRRGMNEMGRIGGNRWK